MSAVYDVAREAGAGWSEGAPAAGRREPLLVLANRLPFSCRQGPGGQWECAHSSGGLVSALEPLMRRNGGRWIGWPGVARPCDGSLRRRLDALDAEQSYEVVPVLFGAELMRDFYEGFSNRVLWPLLHGLSGVELLTGQWWHAYQAANRRFAAALLERPPAAGFTWVHDYHLMLVAAYARQAGYRGRMGFFLHTPFPPAELFARLPGRDALLSGLLAFDLVGFQTRRDVRNFVACLERATPEGPGAPAGERPDRPRRVRVGDFPIGIDAGDFSERARSGRVARLAAALRERHAGRRIMLGVDRLDRTKGLEQKLAAFGRALVRAPRLRGRVTLVQQVVPSREGLPEHQRLRQAIERMVGEINERYGHAGWRPVHYAYGSLAPEELLAHYRAAAIALVTPLRDGMNLVAKEYCAASVDAPGVLVLSEFAGCAAELGAAAVEVNPFDADATAGAIETAFDMGEAERAARMARLRRLVRENDVNRWAESYLAAAATL